MKDEYRSRVCTDRPAYADYDAPRKFEAIKSIIGRRLKEHPNAICSYSGGSDSDIMIHLIETVREMFDLPPVHYCFFNTGLEMAATKRHVKETEEKYGVEIKEYRPKVNIVMATRKYGLPLMSKIFSQRYGYVQKHNIPLEIVDEFNSAEDKKAKLEELIARYPRRITDIYFILGVRDDGMPTTNKQFMMNSYPYMTDFIKENPVPFTVSAKCCDYCKKQPAHEVMKNFDMMITGEREQEGGIRTVNGYACFGEKSDGSFRLRPLYYVSDQDKQWYKDYYGIKYSDAYEVYGMKRTGCCGCPISYRAVDDLELIKPYEPVLVRAAWNVFGESYKYRQQYNEYKAKRQAQEKAEKAEVKGQCTLPELS